MPLAFTIVKSSTAAPSGVWPNEALVTDAFFAGGVWVPPPSEAVRGVQAVAHARAIDAAVARGKRTLRLAGGASESAGAAAAGRGLYRGRRPTGEPIGPSSTIL